MFLLGGNGASYLGGTLQVFFKRLRQQLLINRMFTLHDIQISAFLGILFFNVICLFDCQSIIN